MQDFVTLEAGTVRVLIAAHAVTRQAYKAYLRAAGLALPPPLARADSPSQPATYVSQVEAAQYCRWLGTQERQPYRLPKMAELLELYGAADAAGIGPEIWPHGDVGGLHLAQTVHEAYTCEWTAETEVVPQYGARPDRVMGTIFYPPWLREGPNASHVRASLDPAQGYSFVSFRVAREAIRV